MSKQSSVDWLLSFIEPSLTPEQKHFFSMVIEQAKAMHKAETCQFAVDWFQNCPIGGDVNSTEDATEYYKDTFA